MHEDSGYTLTDIIRSILNRVLPTESYRTRLTKPWAFGSYNSRDPEEIGKFQETPLPRMVPGIVTPNSKLPGATTGIYRMPGVEMLGRDFMLEKIDPEVREFIEKYRAARGLDL